MVLPAIISSTSSGAIGGNDIVIGGSGFSQQPSDIQVSIDNVPCEVTYSNLTEIQCKLAGKNT